MIYDGTLTMPANFAALDEEEMTYVDGGTETHFFSTKYDARDFLNDRAWMCVDYMGFLTVACAALGSNFYLVVGTAVCDYIMDDWRKTYAAAAHTANHLGWTNNVKVTIEINWSTALDINFYKF